MKSKCINNALVVTLDSDSKQSLDLNLGIAPPSFSDNQVKNIHNNGSGLQVQRSWDDIPIDRRVMVRLDNVVKTSGCMLFFLKSATSQAPLLFHLFLKS